MSSANWPTLALAELCEINPRAREPNGAGQVRSVTFVPMSAIDEVHGTIARPEMRLAGDVAKGYTPFREGDVLFAKITPCMENGKAAIARGLIDGVGFGSTEFHILRAGPKVRRSGSSRAAAGIS